MEIDVVAQRQRAVAEGLVVAQAEIDLVDEGDAAARAHGLHDGGHLLGARSRCRWGCCGDASSTPRVAGLQCARHRGGVELEARRRRGRQQPRRGASARHEVPVAGVAGVGHQHLVAGLEQRQAGQLQRRRRARGDDDARRVDVHAEARAVPAGDALAQRGQAGGVRVLRAAAVAGSARRPAAPAARRVKSGSPMFRNIIGSPPAPGRRPGCAPAARRPWRTPSRRRARSCSSRRAVRIMRRPASRRTRLSRAPAAPRPGAVRRRTCRARR